MLVQQFNSLTLCFEMIVNNKNHTRYLKKQVFLQDKKKIHNGGTLSNLEKQTGITGKVS